MVKIAIAKGRVAKDVLDILKETGLEFEEINRKLVINDSKGKVSLIFVKSSDVATYVENAVADIGIVGKDILNEENYDLYEIFDLGMGKCKMCLAGPRDVNYLELESISIASKYPEQAKKFLKSIGKTGRVIKLNGSVELGPLVGISDFIVDIVETGATLKENNLDVIEEISDISTRIVANKVTFKTKNDEISQLLDSIKAVLDKRENKI